MALITLHKQTYLRCSECTKGYFTSKKMETTAPSELRCFKCRDKSHLECCEEYCKNQYRAEKWVMNPGKVVRCPHCRSHHKDTSYLEVCIEGYEAKVFDHCSYFKCHKKEKQECLFTFDPFVLDVHEHFQYRVLCEGCRKAMELDNWNHCLSYEPVKY